VSRDATESALVIFVIALVLVVTVMILPWTRAAREEHPRLVGTVYLAYITGLAVVGALVAVTGSVICLGVAPLIYCGGAVCLAAAG